jgi:ribosomal protein S18 acetylase RimI-like enzyme
MKIDLFPFTDEFYLQAGELLAQAHHRDRVFQPLLPVRFEDPIFAQEAVRQELEKNRSTAVIAISDGQLLGFMIGRTVHDQLWGRNAWVSLAGCALSPEQNAGLVGRMYAFLGEQWIANGYFDHFVIVALADSELVQSWFELSFGIEQVYGVVKLREPAIAPALAIPEDLTIRRAVPDDRSILEGLSEIIWRHQIRAPVWAFCVPEYQAELRQGYAELVDDPDATVWLAFHKTQVAGFQCYFPAGSTDMNRIIPESCIELKVAGTLPQFQGLGIGRALTGHGLADAYRKGYRNCLTDWRSTNLLSSRFWPSQGFHPVAYRLMRRIDAQIAWANG